MSVAENGGNSGVGNHGSGRENGSYIACESIGGNNGSGSRNKINDSGTNNGGEFVGVEIGC